MSEVAKGIQCMITAALVLAAAMQIASKGAENEN